MNEPIVYFAWESPGHEHCKRTRIWWLVAVIVVIGLFTHAILTKNFAFAVILIMFGIIMMHSNRQQEHTHQVVVADSGLLVDNNFFAWSDLREFFIVEDIGKLYVLPDSFLGSHLDIALAEGMDIEELRLVLREQLRENTEEKTEPLMDIISRKLGLF